MSHASASSPEKVATSPTSTGVAAPKLRSCVVCRSRKVRCNRQSPCSHCRRANIPCVYPSTDGPPRWARRLERLASNAAASAAPSPQSNEPDVGKVMERLRTLERLVRELSSQLEQAQIAARSADQTSAADSLPPDLTSNSQVHPREHPAPASDGVGINEQFGRMVLQDSNRSRYVSSSFWSRIDEELDLLKLDARGLAGEDSDSSDDEAWPEDSAARQEPDSTPFGRPAFLFRQDLGLSPSDLRELHPLPSQIPFLVDVFSENVNYFIRFVHLPTVNKIVRDWRSSGMQSLTPSNEALMFAIYYTAIASMEDDDVMANFDVSKTDLCTKYRLGLENALAKADFLNEPDTVLVQAFTLFLFIARRHENPRVVYMMTGLVIRMAQYIGLHRDGAHFKHLTPFEVEMRRRVWWVVCMLDMRSSEDQGTDLTIASGSFDTKIPLNINDTDIGPESKEMPAERYGVTDMSFPRIAASMTDVMRKMMALGITDDMSIIEEKGRLVNEIYQKFDQEYFQHSTESGNIAYWVAASVARLIMAKMTLIVFLPIIFSTQNQHMTAELRNKLLISAIEVAEYNHVLNAEQACRQWRWVYQTHTHWHAIVYLMIETSRRPWSPMVERAWVALHSSWLIPSQASAEKNRGIWIPLRRLIGKAGKHRNSELARLRANPQAAALLEVEDQEGPWPSSSGPFATGSSAVTFRERWRQLIAAPDASREDTSAMSSSGAEPNILLSAPTYRDPSPVPPISDVSTGFSGATAAFGSTHLEAPVTSTIATHAGVGDRQQEPGATTDAYQTPSFAQADMQSFDPAPAIPADWSAGLSMGPGFIPGLWGQADGPVDVSASLEGDFLNPNMDFGGEVNWFEWFESAKGIDEDKN